MTHLQKLRTQHFLKWGSFNFSQNNLNSSKPPLFYTVKFCFLKNPRFYSSQRVVETETFENAVKENNVKISPATRAQAQTALLEYLYYTRSFLYADAEYMSRNSPHFLDKLLKRVYTTEANTDIKHLLTRFLRYHPIDEFELFFESLGLEPLEFASLLPRNLTFLSVDKMLLENCRVLCNYGIERNKIGKMYKEATEIFRYDYDMLMSKIRAYEELGLEQRLLMNAIVSSPTVLIGDVNSSFVEVLEKLKIMGFDCFWIESRFKEHGLINWNQILEVLYAFDRLGFTGEQLFKLIYKNPRLLYEGSGKITSSLIGLLLKFGSTQKELFLAFLEFPPFEIGQLIYNLRRAIQLFTDIEMEPEHFGRIVCSYPILLCGCTLKKCSTLLKNLNVGKEQVCNIVIENTQELKNWVLGAKIQPIPNVMKNLDSDSEIISRQEKIKEGELEDRFNCLVKAGLDRKAVVEIVNAAPKLLNQSTGVIEMKIDFLLNNLKLPISTLKTFPGYLCYTIQRVKLRFTILCWLKDQGIIVKPLALSTIIAISDKCFEKEYVKRHPKGPQVWKRLRKQICNIVIENPQEMKNWVLGAKIQPVLKEMKIISQEEKSKFLLDLGFVKESKEMKKALNICRGKGGELEERFNCFVKAGLDHKAVVEMVKSTPQILNQSKDAIHMKIDFLLNGLKLPISTLEKCSEYVTYTIRRVKLRYTMLCWLKDQGLIARPLALSTILAKSEKVFEKVYVEKHPKGPQVWQKLRKQICNVVIENQQETKNRVLGAQIQPVPKAKIISRQEKIKFLLNLGYVEDSKEMKRALKIVRGKGGELQERFNCFVKAGLDCQDVVQMVRRTPQILNQSKDVIEMKIDFFLSDLKLPLSTLMIFPRHLCFTIQRMKLRIAMYSWLKDQGTVRHSLTLNTICEKPDKCFERVYVEKHPKGPQLWQILRTQILFR